MKFSIRQTAVQLIAAILIFLFAYTVVSKFFNYTAYRFNLEHAPVVKAYPGIAAIGILIFNLLVVLLLLIPYFRRIGFFLAIFLLLCYSGYIAYAVFSSKELPCSCNGIVPWLSWMQHLWLNLILTALAVTGLVLSKRLIAINPPVMAMTGNRES